jgi:hypothetical protein
MYYKFVLIMSKTSLGEKAILDFNGKISQINKSSIVNVTLHIREYTGVIYLDGVTPSLYVGNVSKSIFRFFEKTFNSCQGWIGQIETGRDYYWSIVCDHTQPTYTHTLVITDGIVTVAWWNIPWDFQDPLHDEFSGAGKFFHS